MDGEGEGEDGGNCVLGCNFGKESKACGRTVLGLFLGAERGPSAKTVLLTTCGCVIVSSESEDSVVGFFIGRSARL